MGPVPSKLTCVATVVSSGAARPSQSNTWSVRDTERLTRCTLPVNAIGMFSPQRFEQRLLERGADHEKVGALERRGVLGARDAHARGRAPGRLAHARHQREQRLHVGGDRLVGQHDDGLREIRRGA